MTIVMQYYTRNIILYKLFTILGQQAPTFQLSKPTSPSSPGENVGENGNCVRTNPPESSSEP